MTNTPQSDQSTLIGLICVVLGAMLFSLKGIFIKLAYQYGVDVVTLMALRMSIALPFYVIIGTWYALKHTQTRLSLGQNLSIFGVGIIGYYVASFLDLSGLTYINASLERLILYLYPSMVLILSVIFLKESITRQQIMALFIGYCGILLFMLEGTAVPGHGLYQGSLLVLASALSFAIFIILSGKLIPRVGSVRFTTIAMSAASLAILLHYSVTKGITIPSQPIQVWAYAGLIAVFSTVLPSYLMSAGIARVGASNASLMGAVGPATTALLAVYVLDEAFGVTHFLGLLLVVLAILILSRQKRIT